MELNFVKIWHEMGIPAKAVALSLVVMALASLGVFIERVVYLLRASGENKVFAAKAAKLMKTNDLVGITKAAAAQPKAPLAKLLHAGAFKYLEYAETADENGLSSLEAAKREMARKSEGVSAELRRGFGILASVGSLAPFVGLLGTVLGILTTFGKIGSSGSAGLGSVMGGIAEALVETAFGLAVAIPSVAAFNYLTTRVDGMERDLTGATGEFVDELERHGEPVHHAGKRAAA
jgi:biopolymer transport protein ExbB